MANEKQVTPVAIHNKNGKGLLRKLVKLAGETAAQSQSTIKMEKGYYRVPNANQGAKTRRNPQ